MFFSNNFPLLLTCFLHLHLIRENMLSGSDGTRVSTALFTFVLEISFICNYVSRPEILEHPCSLDYVFQILIHLSE